jgi:release factor glutamine methyltransferase
VTTGPAAITSLDALLHDAAARLAAAGVTGARGDAEQLAAHVLALPRGELLAAVVRGDPVGAAQAEVFEALVVRRVDREPLQHLTGRAAFRRIELAVGSGVFVPRPETEVLAGLAIDEAQRVVSDRAAARPLVLDLCTGSGAVALAVADEVADVRVVAVELDPAALGWAMRNVHRLGAGRQVELRRGDAAHADTGVAADLRGRVDVVVSNPPYIPAGARPVDPEVADHDPPLALFGGGQDGLDVPRAVVAAAAGLLRRGGLLLMEHADLQGPATRALASEGLWAQVHTVADLSGRDRVLSARRR